jgi:hypothetical protein
MVAGSAVVLRPPAPALPDHVVDGRHLHGAAPTA